MFKINNQNVHNIKVTSSHKFYASGQSTGCIWNNELSNGIPLFPLKANTLLGFLVEDHFGQSQELSSSASGKINSR